MISVIWRMYLLRVLRVVSCVWTEHFICVRKNIYKTAAPFTKACWWVVEPDKYFVVEQTEPISQEDSSFWSHAPCRCVRMCPAWCRTWPGSSWWAWSSATTVSWGCGACSRQRRDYTMHSPLKTHLLWHWAACILLKICVFLQVSERLEGERPLPHAQHTGGVWCVGKDTTWRTQ